MSWFGRSTTESRAAVPYSPFNCMIRGMRWVDTLGMTGMAKVGDGLDDLYNDRDVTAGVTVSTHVVNDREANCSAH